MNEISVDVTAMMSSLSNWGRWGDDDQLGTLNLVDPIARRRGAALVTDGTVVSCAHDIRPEGPNAQRYMVGTGLGREPGDQSAERTGASDHGHTSVAAEFIGFIYHGMTITHIDAPSHVFWDGRMYNGAPSSLVDDRHGATRCDVRVAAEGIVTRGVLVDMPDLLGVEAMDPGQPIMPEHLDAAVEKAGVTLEPGDVLLVRTSEAARRRAVRSGYTGAVQPGLDRRLPAVAALTRHRHARLRCRPRRPSVGRQRVLDADPHRRPRRHGSVADRQLRPRLTRPALRPTQPLGIPVHALTTALPRRHGKSGEPPCRVLSQIERSNM